MEDRRLTSRLVVAASGRFGDDERTELEMRGPAFDGDFHGYERFGYGIVV